MSTSGGIPPSVELLQKATGLWISQAIYVAAHLSIADLLKDGPRPVDELAEVGQVHAPSLYRVLRALASVGIFAEDNDGRFKLTPMAEPLQSAVPGSLRDFVLMLGQEWHWGPWGQLLQSVTTGQTAFEHVYGMSLFDFMAKEPKAAEIHVAAMTSRSGDENEAVIPAYDFSTIGTIVDVGCGEGSLLTAILKANPRLHGIFFDLPHVIDGARRYVAAEGLEDRSDVIAGNFMESVPVGGDVYLLKKVIHNWDDKQAVLILDHCHQAMAEAGRILLVELVIPPGNAPFFGKTLDLMMLVSTSGRVRTEAEHRALLDMGGFGWKGITPTRSPLISIVEGIRR